MLPLSLADAADVLRLLLQPPPLHPILVNMTAGLIPAAVFFDSAGRFNRRASLSSAGWWMTVLAAVVTPFTALAGWLWLDEMGGHGDPMLVHKWLGTSLAVLVIGLALWRWRERRRETQPDARVGARPAYIAAGAVFVVFLVAQGHIGGMLSFGSGGGHGGGGGHAEGAAAPDEGWKASVPAADATEEGGHEHGH
ncbi:DUF2231 domain-containing protein [Phycisphaera mikurensis]|uniref:DUF2231 domain-containing protein n=1 Tax=Phycisphaera mikurensis (strain NBRC 102666 / KCTC 22515 / FYK2301M01) TaxID=1142394 RepID=I0IJF7_PHYMF|nr:DUF2231 domain-containing protein [Phycisphaera mikurensis]MBB6443145.1 putative membrane protein [Phycisphaera mikurensis]BAM05395.1 hypothetical protein PSMK_p00330 [Phycisphaera mikurensis NBRC 102666]